MSDNPIVTRKDLKGPPAYACLILNTKFWSKCKKRSYRSVLKHLKAKRQNKKMVKRQHFLSTLPTLQSTYKTTHHIESNVHTGLCRENWKKLRKQFATSKAIPLCTRSGKQRTPTDICNNALRNLESNFKSNTTVLLQGKKNYFRLGFKSKKFQAQDVISLSARSTKVVCALEHKQMSLDETPPPSFSRRFNRWRKRHKGWPLKDVYFSYLEKKKNKAALQRRNKRNNKTNENKENKNYNPKWRLITHLHPYCSYLSSPIAIEPFSHPTGELDFDYKILKRGNKYFAVLPFAKPIHQDSPQHKRVVALDPGANVFLTGYNPEGEVIHVGCSIKEQIFKSFDKLDKLEIRQEHGTKCQRRNFRQRRQKIQLHLNNMVKDFHYKTAKFLVGRYQHVVLPKFSIPSMVQKINDDGKKRKLQRPIVRLLHTQAHSKFRQILFQQEEENTGSKVHIGTEEFTSITCGNCLHVHRGLPWNKMFYCNKCQLSLERDPHAARNIYLLAATRNTICAH